MRKPLTTTDSVAQDQIRAFVERVERLHEERVAIGDDIKEVFAEARGNGFDIKALKIVISKRRQDQSERAELEALVELYEAALGGLYGSSDDDEDEPRAPAPARASRVPTRTEGNVTTILSSNSGHHGAETGELSTTPEPADPDSSGVAADQGEEGSAPALLAKPDTTVSSAAVVSPTGADADANEGGSHEAVAHSSNSFETAPQTNGDGRVKLDEMTAGNEAGHGADRDGIGSDVEPVAPTAADNARKIRPWCLHADDLSKCGGYGKTHCHSCLKAHADEEGIAA